MCMFQYERYMQCTRIPGEVMDTLRVYHGSGHVIVIIQDQIFWVHVMHPDGTVLTTSELEYQLSRIERMATERSHRQTHYALPALTAENRGVWAELRQKLLQNPVNARNLDIVESCVCVLVLSDDEPQDSSDLMKKAFAGNGRNIWFDKSSIVVVHKNGKVGFNGEHAHADAPMPCRMLDLAVSSVIAEMKQGSDPLSPSAAALLDDPQPIDWELDEEMKASISTAVENVEKIINDTDVGAGEVMTFGREFLKQERLSPDSFVQMALQLAFLRDQGHITAVYESATTKQFYHARTETCRSLTNESKAFIEAMDNREISQHEKLNLMRNAIAAHKDYMKDAVFGQGVDRHLTGLYATAMESGIEIPQFFSDPGYVKSTTWELSTSNMTFSGRPGFPPPFDYSYGVCYGVHANSIVFAVTCRRSCKGKSASRFARQLELALLDMQRLTLSTHARL